MISESSLLRLAVVRSLIFGAFAVMVCLTSQAAAQNCWPCGPDSIPPALKRLIPQGVAGADFREACRIHDQCYAKGTTRTQADCDCEFLHNLLQECQNSHNPRRCQRRARFMYRLTRRYGGSSFGT